MIVDQIHVPEFIPLETECETPLARHPDALLASGVVDSLTDFLRLTSHSLGRNRTASANTTLPVFSFKRRSSTGAAGKSY